MPGRSRARAREGRGSSGDRQIVAVVCCVVFCYVVGEIYVMGDVFDVSCYGRYVLGCGVSWVLLYTLMTHGLVSSPFPVPVPSRVLRREEAHVSSPHIVVTRRRLLSCPWPVPLLIGG